MGREKTPVVMLKKVSTLIGYTTIAAFLAVALLLVGMMLPFVPYQMKIVESGSMEPTIPTGSVIFISSAASYTVGDVVTFQRSGEEEVTTHRIVEERIEEGKEVFLTQGDANDAVDTNPVFPAEISGKMWGHIPYLGYLLSFFRQPIGFLLLIGVPAVLIINEQIGKIRAELRKQQTTKEETNAADDI